MTALPAVAGTTKARESGIDSQVDERSRILREAFGLPPRQLGSPVAPQSLSTFAVALSEAELALVRESVRIEGFIDVVVEAAQKHQSYAGLYIDHKAGGTMVVLFAEAEDGEHPELRALLPEDLRDRLVIGSAEFTQDQLLEVLEDLVGFRSHLGMFVAEVNMAFWDVAANRVVIGGRGLGNAAAAELWSRYGDRIVIEDGDIATQVEVCSSRTDCTPFQAGIRVTKSGGAIGSGGFIARNFTSTNFYWFTAGHFEPGGGTGSSYSHNIYSAGTSVANAYVNNSSADALLLDIPDAQKSNKRYSNINVSGSQGSAMGSTACLTGEASGNFCGTVVGIGGMVTYPDGTTLLNQIFANYGHMGGDSGGGIYRVVSGTNYALGGHSGFVCCPDKAVYSTIANMTSALGVSLNTTP